MGQYEEALESYEKCLAVDASKFGKDHPDYAKTLNNIGSTYHKMKRYEEALKIYEECQAIQKSVLGKKHPNYAVALNNIG